MDGLFSIQMISFLSIFSSYSQIILEFSQHFIKHLFIFHIPDSISLEDALIELQNKLQNV